MESSRLGKLLDGIQTIAIAGNPFRSLFPVPEGQILGVGNFSSLTRPGKIDSKYGIVIQDYLVRLGQPAKESFKVADIDRCRVIEPSMHVDDQQWAFRV